MIQKLTYGYRSAFVCLLVVLGVLMVPILADEEQGGGGVVVGPEGADPATGMEGGPAPLNPNRPNVDDNDSRVAADADLMQLGVDIRERGYAVPEVAFDIFPAAVKVDIQDLMTRLLPVIDSQDQVALDAFFDKEGDRIATVFDQLGLTPNADSLIAGPAFEAGGNSTRIKFPNEFKNYEGYLESLELEDFERDYMLVSRQIVETYESSMIVALGERERVQSALEIYQTQLESLNERYAEQFRELSLESIERAGADGRRPDIDR